MSLMSEGMGAPAGAAVAQRCEPSIATAGDFLALMKPRVMSLVVLPFIAFAALFIETGLLRHGP